jgi:hypothetical protein
MLIFGIDSKLFLDNKARSGIHTEEVETITLYRGRGTSRSRCSCHETRHEYTGDEKMYHTVDGIDANGFIDGQALADELNGLSKEMVWRVKGFVRLEGGMQILNWAFGRYELTAVEGVAEVDYAVKLTVMGERGAVKGGTRPLAFAMGAVIT